MLRMIVAMKVRYLALVIIINPVYLEEIRTMVRGVGIVRLNIQ